MSDSITHPFFFPTNHLLPLSVYRVIKNQPPPILSIELDHNPFKCPATGCTKSFRKAILLHYHIKYYHSDQQLDERGSEQEAQRWVDSSGAVQNISRRKVVYNSNWCCCRRKRSSSEGGDYMSDRKNENQNSTCHREDREQSTIGTGRTATRAQTTRYDEAPGTWFFRQCYCQSHFFL